MPGFDVCLRYPSLGNPCLVRTAPDGGDLIFGATFSAATGDLDLRSYLEGNLFLQKLSDTRTVIQQRVAMPWDGYANAADLAARWSANWNIAAWPPGVQAALIPLEVVAIWPSTHSPWNALTPRGYKRANVVHFRAIDDGSINWLPQGQSPEATDRWYPEQQLLERNLVYWVTLRIPRDRIRGMSLPQLFNLVQTYPAAGICDISFHSVYLHGNGWDSFSFIHAADSHVAWRNEFIQPIVRRALSDPGAAADFIHYNENFRKFISCANQLHRQGRCDFIVLNGDLVDFIGVPTYIDQEAALEGRGRWASTVPGYAIPQDNYELFCDLVTAWPKFPGAIVGEELEVPLFTIPGNHDYRPHPYPLICTFRFWLAFGYVYHYYRSDFREFGLWEHEARAYETGIPNGIRYSEAQVGINAQLPMGRLPDQYRARINSEPDYTISLGPHRIICLASGADSGAITSWTDALTNDTLARRDLKDHIGHGQGFSDSQIGLVRDQARAAALVVVASHHPLFLPRMSPDVKSIPPPRLFRETEHNAMNAAGKKDLEDLLIGIYADDLALGDQNAVRSLLDAENPSRHTVLHLWTAATGWSMQDVPYFKRGSREPDMANGSIDNHFLELMKIASEETSRGRKIQLFLSGHTHKSVEFNAYADGAQIIFKHDYYIDGTINRHSPSAFWQTENGLPDYADPLRDASNPQEWWSHHSPLFVNTVSVTAPAGGDRTKWDMGFLRITVEDNVITHISRESQLEPVSEPVQPRPRSAAALINLALEPAKRPKPRAGLTSTSISFILE